MWTKLRYLLLQARNANDPMREHEVNCFARVLKCERFQIEVFDLLEECPTPKELQAVDMVLLGGSGEFSVAEGGPWQEPAYDAMRVLSELSKPTFASCWGFQAMAKALGGKVIADMDRAEAGSQTFYLTDAGKADPVFGPLGDGFHAQTGHHDVVDQLPDDAILLASTELTKNQAYRLNNKPIYCTQFHPELTKDQLLERLKSYPTYVESIAKVSFEQFAEQCVESPEMDEVLPRFVQHVFGD